ncbi:MAG: glycosyltransferase N-terminal domain-containing protein [Bacteroidota bacterium]
MYDIVIYSFGLVLRLLAFFNPKIKKGVMGRSQTFTRLKNNINPSEKTLWFHCASLGEYEQGLPVFKALRKDNPNHKIILSFFSPSGYEVRKNSEIADIAVYLPIDTKKHAIRFLDAINPELSVFVKYDIWPNLLLEVKKRNLRAILISAHFRKNQVYFKSYGNYLKKVLFTFEHIFVQDEKSKKLLNSIRYKNVTVSGDTRYDRVSAQLEQNNNLDFILDFKNKSLCVVIGSSWPEDEEILVDFINENASKDLKFIIAPHEINSIKTNNLLSIIKLKTVLFSDMQEKNLSDYNIFIIDTVGHLSKIYNHADIAYVGGAMGTTGLHNILEPAIFGIPIIIGKNYTKFPEAIAMIEQAGVTSIKNPLELKMVLNTLILNKEYRKKQGQLNRHYIDQNKGAIVQIMDYLRT